MDKKISHTPSRKMCITQLNDVLSILFLFFVKFPPNLPSCHQPWVLPSVMSSRVQNKPLSPFLFCLYVDGCRANCRVMGSLSEVSASKKAASDSPSPRICGWPVAPQQRVALHGHVPPPGCSFVWFNLAQIYLSCCPRCYEFLCATVLG